MLENKKLIGTSVFGCIATILFLVVGTIFAFEGIVTTEGAAVEGNDFLEVVSIVGSLVIGAFSIVAAMIKEALADYDFCARREKDRIFVHCGLFKKREYAVPIDKVNAVSLEYSFIGRLCKRAYVKVINIGGEKQEAQGVKILLADSYEELERKMKILLPEYTLPELKELKRPPFRALLFRAYYSTAVVLCLGLGAIFGFAISTGTIEKISLSAAFSKMLCLSEFPYAVLALVVLWGFLVIFNLLSHCTAGLSQNDKHITIANGIFKRRIRNISYRKIQYLTFKEGILERKFGLCRGNFAILASAANQTQMIGRYAKENFAKLEKSFYQSYHREDTN